MLIIYLSTYYTRNSFPQRHKDGLGWWSAIGASHFTIPILSPFTSVVSVPMSLLTAHMYTFLMLGWTWSLHYRHKIDRHTRYHCGLPSLRGLPVLALAQTDNRWQFFTDIHVIFCPRCYTSHPSRNPTIHRQIIYWFAILDVKVIYGGKRGIFTRLIAPVRLPNNGLQTRKYRGHNIASKDVHGPLLIVYL